MAIKAIDTSDVIEAFDAGGAIDASDSIDMNEATDAIDTGLATNTIEAREAVLAFETSMHRGGRGDGTIDTIGTIDAIDPNDLASAGTAALGDRLQHVVDEAMLPKSSSSRKILGTSAAKRCRRSLQILHGNTPT